MWTDALATCHKEGADLASIHSIEEQSFIISQSGYCMTAISIFSTDYIKILLYDANVWTCALNPQRQQMCSGLD